MGSQVDQSEPTPEETVNLPVSVLLSLLDLGAVPRMKELRKMAELDPDLGEELDELASAVTVARKLTVLPADPVERHVEQIQSARTGLFGIPLE